MSILTEPKQAKTRTRKPTTSLFYVALQDAGYLVTALDKRGNEGESRTIATARLFDAKDDFAAAALVYALRCEAGEILAAGPLYSDAWLDKHQQIREVEEKHHVRLIIPRAVLSEIEGRARLFVPSFDVAGKSYEVHIGADGGGTAFCNCGAYDRRGRCKHIALSGKHLRARAEVAR